MKCEELGDKKRDILCPFACILFVPFHPVAIPDATQLIKIKANVSFFSDKTKLQLGTA